MLKRPKRSFESALRTGLEAVGCLALLLWINLLPALAAEPGAEDMGGAIQAMQGAEKDFQRAEEDFRKAANANAAQTTATMPLSGINAQTSSTYAGSGSSATAAAQTMAGSSSSAMFGSPETGYAGTWTDQNGDIITSVIAPTPRQSQNYSQYPIVIEPSIGSWNSSGGSGSNSSGNNPQWPTTPDNPGWGTFPGSNSAPPPPPPAFAGPGSYPGQNFYPSPPLPPNFHPGYRPLYPPAPGHWQNPGGPGAMPGGASRPPSPPFGAFPPPPGGGWGPGRPSGNYPVILPGINQGLGPGASSGQGWNRPPNFPVPPRPGMVGRPGSNSSRGMP